VREIKFRAKSLLGLKPMIKGNYLYNEFSERHNIAWRPEHDNWQLCPVDGDTIGQFTGLTDKNGKDIYEGDIINSNYFKKGIVVFWRSGWHLNTGKDCHHSFNTSIHSFEVIGNIHENSEIL